MRSALDGDPEEEEEDGDEDLVEGGSWWGKKAADAKKEPALVVREAGAAAKDVRRAKRGAGGRGEGPGPMEQFRLLLARSWRQVNRAKFANATRVRTIGGGCCCPAGSSFQLT